jgi:hypothetical protein
MSLHRGLRNFNCREEEKDSMQQSNIMLYWNENILTEGKEDFRNK